MPCECKVVPTCSRSEPHRIEYCALHRAAPELLASLKAAIHAGIIDQNGEPENARAAIAKAEGGTK